MSPLRRVHPSLTWHDWRFWIVVAFFFMGAWAIFGYVQNRQAIDELKTERNVRIAENASAVALALRSLCDQRQSYTDQLAATKAYLAKHPHGIPSLGFSRAAILNQEHSLKLRLQAYQGLKCQERIPR